MNSSPHATPMPDIAACAFLKSAGWKAAVCEPLTGDASVRRYLRVRAGSRSAVLMDASQTLESVAPFIQMGQHLRELGFSAPAILARDEPRGLLLLEDFGDDTFTRLLADANKTRELYTLAVDVLTALHRLPRAVPDGLRAYHPERMLSDIELFLEWCTPGISEDGQAAFRSVWRDILPLAHRVSTSFLHRDYHVANLMWLPGRDGVRRVGLLDFQDAYQGPVTYDLVSLLEDARRDVAPGLKSDLLARYREQFPGLDKETFQTSCAILAALRHTRVLAIFERLSRHEGKQDYKRLHSPRVERLLRSALSHPVMKSVSEWFDAYAW